MLNKEKGITLIALIITIIVMLILVGVTINVALNGGLFQKAELAKEQTTRELEKEELMSIAVAAYNANTRKVEKSDLDFNGKYSEETDKTTAEKIVVKGKTGVLWQIDISSAKVEEYSEKVEGYAFTLNSLGNWETSDDSAIFFDANKLWEVIGEDLSVNEQYNLQGMYRLSSDDYRFGDFLAIILGIDEAKPENIYAISGELDNEKFRFIVKEPNTSENDIWTDSSVEDRQAFLDEYGDVVFKIEDISDIEIPT